MSYIKLISSRYEKESDVIRVVRYIAEMKKSTNLIGGGMGIINADEIHRCPNFIADQFLVVQRYKGCRGRRLYHVVVSFDSIIDEMNIYEIRTIADSIVHLYRDYQSVYALHENTRNMHLHILFNNISLGDERNLSYDINILDISMLVNNMIDNYKAAKKY